MVCCKERRKRVVKEDKWDAKCAFIKLLDRHSLRPSQIWFEEEVMIDQELVSGTPSFLWKSKGWEEMAVRDQLRQARQIRHNKGLTGMDGTKTLRIPSRSAQTSFGLFQSITRFMISRNHGL
jgi:hypothetical protein